MKVKITKTYVAETKFIWPYNMGRMANLRQVLTLSCKPPGDGIKWEVVEGTDQYTLTREQLKQKEDKRERTREYQIISKYTGAWFPVSQGVSVCCHPPCTDEPRIQVEVGDMVRVTRWKKYWLYGEKEQRENIHIAVHKVCIILKQVKLYLWIYLLKYCFTC